MGQTHQFCLFVGGVKWLASLLCMGIGCLSTTLSVHEHASNTNFSVLHRGILGLAIQHAGYLPCLSALLVVLVCF